MVKGGKTMIFNETRVELKELFRWAAEIGDYTVIPSFTLPATKLDFNGKEIECPEFTTPETKLYCIYNANGERQYLFDSVMFNMSIAPFKDGKEVCFKNSFMKKYLKKLFMPQFEAQIYKIDSDWNEDAAGKFKIKCDILSKADIFGGLDDENNGLEWFNEIKHRIACDNEYSRWYWLSDVEEVDNDNASSSSFAFVSNNGHANYNRASYAYYYVRPRFVIRDKDR